MLILYFGNHHWIGWTYHGDGRRTQQPNFAPNESVWMVPGFEWMED